MSNNNIEEFIDLLPRKLDDAQKKALKVNGNAVIAAGAGSGKTQVLATRFAWLVITGQAKVDEILTLTFTNKAASEMYQRIYETLSFFAHHEQCNVLTKENIKLAESALESFSNAHIQTLDSYCGAIVRQAANRYGIKPDFTTGSSDSGRDIKNKAFQFVMENRDNPGIQAFSDAGKLQEFAESTLGSTIEKYTSLATEENYFINKLSYQLNEISAAWNYYALGYIDNNYAFENEILSLKSAVSQIRDALLSSSKRDDPSKAQYVNLIEKLIDSTATISNLPKITKEDIENKTELLKDSLKELNNIFELIESIPSKKGYITEVRKFVTPLKNETVPFIKSIELYITQYEYILELNKLFDEFLLKINSSKRTSGNLSFNDVTELALKILLENEDIRNQEKNAFKKIMIDEFQDNNGKNRDLLYIISLKPGEFEDNGKCKIKISEKNKLISQIVERDENGKIINDRRCENKLFFVGDEKQSIYKFRGAEVSVFNELTKDGENQLISMNYNYRSTSELLESFNRMFKGGMGIFAAPTSRVDYEAYYDKDALKNGIELPALTKESVPVHMNLLDTNSLENSEDYDFIPTKDQLAYFMAKKIYDLGHESKNWSSFAILDRSRTDRNVITKYLSMFKIPYEVDQFNNIFEDGIVNDFYNYFRICVYPSDINSYGVYLASPLCGLNVNQVEIILSHLIDYASENEVAFTPFPNDEKTENGIKNDLSKEAYDKYLAGKSYFQNNRSTVLQQKITATLTDLWHKRGYKYETLLSQQTELSSEHFDMIFELGRQADSQGKNIAWFVDQLELLKKSAGSESSDLDAAGITYPLERKEAVQIMTIHKSKGLQFDHVFIYGCVGVHSKSDNSNIFFEDEFGVTIKPESGAGNYFYLKGLKLSKNKELAEFRRLIYVAVTRAIKDVNIIGSWNPKPKTPPKSQLRLFETATENFYAESEQNDFNDDAGFDYCKIEPVEYSLVSELNDKTTIDKLRENVFEKTDSAYNNPEIIKYQCNPVERKTPSSLEPDFNIENQSDSDTGEKYEQSPDILIASGFTAADFGTLVHAYLEAQANGVPPQEFQPPVGLFKNLTEGKIKENQEQCIKMCQLFQDSTLGRELDNCKNRGDFYRAEWGFRMMYQGSIFTGSIDLIYSNGDGSFTIVDYKSDNSITPELYVGQQHCYRAAASKLLKIPEEKISLRLYYTKKDEVVELD